VLEFHGELCDMSVVAVRVGEGGKTRGRGMRENDRA
jgi:hypothetical protein